MDPRGMVGRIYKEDHYTLLHTKYESSGPCGFREEDFLFFKWNKDANFLSDLCKTLYPWKTEWFTSLIKNIYLK